MKNNLMLPFHNSDKIENHYSQAGQDMFILSVLNGMSSGRFLDIGCNEPKTINNTYLLESVFGWNGILIDMNCDMIDLCKKERTSKCLCGDATTIDYSTLLKEEVFPNIIDYVSLDIDGIASFRALEKILSTNYKARVITFEHDAYKGNNEVRELSRKYLDDLGYLILCADVRNDGSAYEDWYVHPNLVNIERAKVLQCENKEWREILFR